MSKAPVKMINGIPLNGQMMRDITIEYVLALNSNETPTIMPTFERVLLAQGRQMQEKEMESFTKKLETDVPVESMPFEISDISTNSENLQ